MKNKIQDIYKKRQEAHDMLLECDKEIDKLLKEKLTCCGDGCGNEICEHCG